MGEIISEGFVCYYVSMMDLISGIFGALPNIQYASDRLSKKLPFFTVGVEYLARKFTTVFENARILVTWYF